MPLNLGLPRNNVVPMYGSGSGDPPDSMIEFRLSKLEDDVGGIKRDLVDLRERMRAVEVKIDHLPSKDYIQRVAFKSVGILGALGTVLSAFIVFQEKLRFFLGVS